MCLTNRDESKKEDVTMEALNKEIKGTTELCRDSVEAIVKGKYSFFKAQSFRSFEDRRDIESNISYK